MGCGFPFNSLLRDYLLRYEPIHTGQPPGGLGVTYLNVSRLWPSSLRVAQAFARDVEPRRPCHSSVMFSVYINHLHHPRSEPNTTHQKLARPYSRSIKSTRLSPCARTLSPLPASWTPRGGDITVARFLATFNPRLAAPFYTNKRSYIQY